MSNTNFPNLIHSLKSDSIPIVLFGAGDFGELVLYCLNELNIQVSYFCDSNEEKQGKLFCGIETISPLELSKMAPDRHIFITNHYVIQVTTLLEDMGFSNIHNCVELLENTDFTKDNAFSKNDLSNPRHKFKHHWSPLKIKREIGIYKYDCEKATKNSSVGFNIKFMDIVITERCSLKCKDCANLMQYYENPKNSDLDLLLKSTDRLMECINRIGEFRVIGGDPLMNDKMYQVINKLVTYDNAENIVVYTNAKILPKDENLTCLKHNKVSLLITNYGNKLSPKHEELIELLEANNILYVTEPVLEEWQDVGPLIFEKKTEAKLTHLFNSCCASDILTLLDGKLYRCPTAGHGENLGAIPHNPNDVVDLADESISIEETREKLIKFYYKTDYISACSYCKGREYGFGVVKSAIQTKKPLPLFV